MGKLGSSFKGVENGPKYGVKCNTGWEMRILKVNVKFRISLPNVFENAKFQLLTLPV